MVGQPIKDALCRQIAKEGGDEVVFSRVAAGEHIRAIMADYGLSRTMFYQWVHADPEREKAYAVARTLKAEAMVEEAQDILDDPTPILTSAEAKMRADRASFRKWLAGKLDRDTFGEVPAVQVGVTVNAGADHLDALRHHGQMPIEDAEYTLESDDDEGSDARPLHEDSTAAG